MAPNSYLCFFFSTSFIAFSAISLFPLAFSRDIPEITHTFLDVSASLEQARAVLNFDPETVKPLIQQKEPLLQAQVGNSSSFSVQVHPRESLYKSSYEDYKSLVLARLERDSARVEALTTKFQLALEGVKKSDLKPVEKELLPEDLSTPIVSGRSLRSGEYFSRIGVGTPAKPFYMVLDTGSEINWLQCKPCADCYQQSDPIFDPTSSSSYKPLSCASPQCQAVGQGCSAGKCLYQVSYDDGSNTTGNMVTETVSFGSSGSVNNIALGCGHDNEGLFVAAAGVLGLGGGSLSFPYQIKASSFSYCLVDRDSSKSSTLEFNSAPPADSVTTTLLKNEKLDTFYFIGLEGLNVGGKPLSIPASIFQTDASGNGGIIVDSGTVITRLQTQAYNALRDAFVKLTRNLKSTSGVSLFDTCYDLSSHTSVQVPTVSFRFSGGKLLSLPAKNYLIPMDSSGTYCLAFAPTSSSPSIIGNVQQQGIRVSYDLANSRVAFSPNKC
ncbi:protein ASPARTIC PROTEASE IN GUARD CELL 1-like [Juglans microcarpa x Juglans regia]|uniref:protein ASPARTIC PROTEASE IN GUARD CELL 1-like n=1 Tax=Juglans microcarpa x Juglans regia TaxID=2249226 RepID=UPI001B7E127B|nr:protein ASPARTIC PROTEASE IN GUARD CELL 1-like [Juglans microcarpa x Juglans regia]